MDAKEKVKHYQSGANLLARHYSHYKNIGKVQEEKEKRISSPQAKIKGYASSVSGSASDEDCESSNLCHEEETASVGEQSHSKTEIFKPSKVPLHPLLIKSLKNLQFTKPNEVQLKVLSCFAEGQFCIKLCAPSKSGKTTAVIISIMNEFLTDKNKKGLQALVLCPTYELAEACYSFALQLTKLCPLKPCLVVKGKKFNENEKITDELIIATPDKLSVMYSSLNFRKIQFIFFDDADCLSNPKSHFNIFSQTCDKMVKKCKIIVTTSSSSELLNQFINKYMRYNTCIEIEKDMEKKLIQQFYIICNDINDKVDALVHLQTSKSYPGQTIIFCETRDSANQIELLLKDKDIQAVKLVSGKNGLPPSVRNDILEKFRNKEIEVLISTRAFATVVPFEQVTKIVNADIIFNEHILDLDEYYRREHLLRGKKIGFIANFVEQKYEEYLFGGGGNPEGKDIDASQKTKGKAKKKVNLAIEKITLEKFIALF